MNNPLSDAETLKIDDNGNIFELGKENQIHLMKLKGNT